MMTAAEINEQKCESDLVDGRYFTISNRHRINDFKTVVGPIGNNKSVRFTVAGNNDAHIALSESTEKKSNKYRISIGEDKNTKSVIRRNGRILKIEDGVTLSGSDQPDTFEIDWADNQNLKVWKVDV